MRKSSCGALAALGLALLTGCAERQQATFDVARAVASVRAGEAMLTCREACVAEWRNAQQRAAQLTAAGRWEELVALLLQVGFQDDLSLYYLGLAAEGLGAPNAAAGYYRESTNISATAVSCRMLSRNCGGVALPRAAMARLAALEQRLRPPAHRPRPTAPGARAQPVVPVPPAELAPPPHGPAPVPLPPAEMTTPAPAAPAAPPQASEPPPLAEPAPPAAIPGVPPPPATRQPAGAPRSDYIEPPPPR